MGEILQLEDFLPGYNDFNPEYKDDIFKIYDTETVEGSYTNKSEFYKITYFTILSRIAIFTCALITALIIVLANAVVLAGLSENAGKFFFKENNLINRI